MFLICAPKLKISRAVLIMIYDNDMMAMTWTVWHGLPASSVSHSSVALSRVSAWNASSSSTTCANHQFQEE